MFSSLQYRMCNWLPPQFLTIPVAPNEHSQMTHNRSTRGNFRGQTLPTATHNFQKTIPTARYAEAPQEAVRKTHRRAKGRENQPDVLRTRISRLTHSACISQSYSVLTVQRP